MGVLRLTLALAVLLSHAPPGIMPRFFHPALAVHIFYVISGFYMQLVLPKYLEKKGGIKSFYTNRFLRIFPIYWAVLVCTIILLRYTVPIDFSVDFILYVMSNVFILGSDLRMGNFGFTFPQFVPQVWTLVPELLFYTCAPFLLKKRNYVLFIIIGFSIILRVILYNIGFKGGFWHYVCFPIEIGTFLLGSLSCRLYNFLKRSPKNDNLFNYLAMLIFIFTFFHFENTFFPGAYTQDGGVPPNYWAKILLAALSLPILFHFSKDLKIDRYLGDFSYPLYISHFFIIGLINKLDFSKRGLELQVILLTFLFSYLLKEYIDKPIHNIRENFTWSSVYRILNLLKVLRNPLKIIEIK